MTVQSRSRTEAAPRFDERRAPAAEVHGVAMLTPPGDHRETTRRGGASAVPLIAPARLMAETRVAFRREALAFVEAAAREERESVDVDVGQTVEIDAGGLGLLVLVQRRARTHGLPTRLLHAREQVRRLLALTKLDYLFEFVD
jgi:ABC-type transporter Mla MlaB component